MAGSGQPAAADAAARGSAPASAPAPERARGRRSPGRRLAAWLSQERVFRLIPFIAVEAVFILVIIIPFLLTIYISLLRWRANRPFEQAYFSGFLNYERVLGKDEFWMALGRTFYFAGAAVILELLIGFVLAYLLHRRFRGRRLYVTVFLAPMMVVPVVVGYNFSMIYVDSGPSTRSSPRSWSPSASTRASGGCPIRRRRSGRSSSPTSGSGPRSPFSSSCPGSPPCRSSSSTRRGSSGRAPRRSSGGCSYRS